MVFEYFPALQSTHVASLDAPAAVEYFPMLHRMHVAADDCPCCVEYVPVAHGWQFASPLPSVDRYLPTPHRVHELMPDAARSR